MFSENAKITSVTSMDKKTDDKNSVLNFGPISILNCFSKVYENILKTHLVEKMNVSGASQGSIVGPILFNFFFNDFFYFILVASAHNFADDNTLSSFAKTIENLVSILESESEIAINRFKINHMIVNLGKFQAIIFDEHKGKSTNRTININQKEIKAVAKVKLLETEIDDKLNFNHHINNICKSASNQLNALIRLKHLLGFKERKVLVNTFVMSNFNYCYLVWNFSSAQSLNKIENLQKRALRFLLNDYDSTYEDLLEKSGYPNMSLRRKRTLCIKNIKL